MGHTIMAVPGTVQEEAWASHCYWPLSKADSVAASPTPPVLYAFSDADKVSHALADFVIAAQNDAITKRGTFKLAISGGSLAATLAKHLVGEERVKWDKW